MPTRDVERTHEELRRAADRISDNLLELSVDPIRAALDATDLDGATAERWKRADMALAELWQWYGELDGVLERAAGLRAGGRGGDARQRERKALLLGPSITVEQRNVPIDERALLGAPVETTACTPAELLQRMAGAFDDVRSTVGAVRRAWETVRPRLTELARSVDTLASLARELETTEPADLAPLRLEIDALARKLTTDPLGADPAAVAGLEARARALHAAIDGVATVRRTLPQRLERARMELASLRTHEEAAAAARAEAEHKIAHAELPPPAPGAQALAEELERLDTLAAAAAWDEARKGLDAWTRRAAELQAAAVVLAERGAAAVRARNDLRGLLDAYHGMARALRMVEDPRAHALFEQARDELYTAPTDLREAWRRVRRYRQVLAGAPRPEGTAS